MNLAVDANILLAALISPISDTANLFFYNKLYSPEFLFEEFKKYEREIITKSGLSEDDFNTAFSIIFSRINLIRKNKFEEFIEKAKKVCPDEKDTEYFALALKLNCPIWSNDKRLKEQNQVKIISTLELLKEANDEQKS